MKKGDLFALNAGLAACGGLKGVKFAYAIAKNTSIVKKEVDIIQEAIKPSKEFQTYEEKRIQLAMDHAKKDPKGQPIIADNRYVIEDQAVFDEAIKNLREENKDVIDGQKKSNEEYEEMLKEEIEIELYKIGQDLLPEDITASQVTGIMPIINE